MNAKEAKREKSKKRKRLLALDVSIRRRRIKKGEYRLSRGAYKEFKKAGSKHDVFFHLMMRDPVFASRFLDAYLPAKLRDALDLSDPNKIQTLATDFYDRRGKKHIADLIFVIPCKEDDGVVSLTVIVEHKAQSGSKIDRKTIAQLLKYVALEVEILLRGKHKIIYQPLVVLFYTGSDRNFEAPAWEKFFPLPKPLQIEELQGSQIRFEPVCVNLTRLFLDNKLNGKDFLRIVPEAMARASLKRLKESWSTLFNPLETLHNLTDEDRERLDACVNYVASAAEQPMTEEELESLQLSVNNEEARKDMKTILDRMVDRGRDEGRKEGRDEGRKEGRDEGRIEGKIETIETVASLRFQENSRRLSTLLVKLNDLNLLDLICQFALKASSLLEVENFAENMIQAKSVVRTRPL